MTRLINEWVYDVSQNISNYEKEFIKLTGMSFIDLMGQINGMNRQQILACASEESIAIIPFESGLGIIEGFSKALNSVLNQSGFRAFITKERDVAGIHEAITQNASILFMADDNRYISWHLKRNKISENDHATARGYIAILEKLSNGTLANKSVLVLGCGRLGEEAVKILLKKKAKPCVYDKIQRKAEGFIAKYGIEAITKMDTIKRFQLVFDATSEGGWLALNQLNEKVVFSSPGVPLSIKPDKKASMEQIIIHDCLQIGTIAMLAELIQ
jgi:pyrrolysine biosynthesis protein PylD